MSERRLTVVQMLPALESGGVEKVTLEIGRHLVANGHRSIVVSGGGRMAAQIEREGSEHITLPIGVQSPWTLRHVRAVRGLLRESGADILHLRARMPAWVGWHAWRGMPTDRRPHLVTTVHDLYAPGRYSSVMVRGERVIAISEMIHAYILEHYPRVDPGAIRVIPRGVDPRAYPQGYIPPDPWLRQWYAQYPQIADRFVVTLPAHLTRRNGQEDLIEVMVSLRDAGTQDIHGLIVGSCEAGNKGYMEELQAEIARRGLDDRITLTGYRDDLREILAVSNIVLSLSHEPEAFRRTTLEALSLGRPVIGYDHGGVGEQLAALLPEGRVPVGDVKAISDRILEWREKAPAPGENRIFTLERMLENTLNVYRELTREPSIV